MRETRGGAQGIKGDCVSITDHQDIQFYRIYTNMFIRLFTILFSVVALAGVANATPTELEVRQVSQCNTGSISCCDSTYSVRIFSSTSVT